MKPILTIIAGCNGSGKSSYSSAFTSGQTPAFDYDKIFLEQYASLHDSELREEMAHNLTWKTLQDSIENSISEKIEFTYETNFNATPLYWPERFKSAGYTLRLIYFCLNSVEEAKRRVQIRVENGGHFVPESEIIERFSLGYKHLNENWRFFDEVYLFDTSQYKELPKFFMAIANQQLSEKIHFPEFLIPLIPSIHVLK